MKQITEDMKTTFKEAGCELLTTEYINSRSKLHYVAQCGHKRDIAYNNFKARGQGRLCKSCSNSAIGDRKRLTTETVNDIVTAVGCTIIDNTEYTSNNDYMNIIGSCGHETTASISQLQKGHNTMCDSCTMKSRVSKTKYTEEDVKVLCNKLGCTLHTNSFKDITTSFKVTANCGHETTTSLPIITTKIREGKQLLCAECLLDRAREWYSFSYDQVVNIFKEADCTLLSDSYVNNTQKLEYTASCGHNSTTTLQIFNRGDSRLCKCCRSRHKAEDELVEWLSKYTVVEQGRRDIISPYEIDIYLPEFNLAIEYNGVYWHSEKFKDKNYHLNKTQSCGTLGIELIHIFENEWLTKTDIIKSMLLNKLGKTENRVFARNTEVKPVSSKDTTEFLKHNHRQGSVSSSINLGLYKDDVLLAIMTFSKSRYSTKADYELLRFCNKLNTTVIGGAGKLFKYFNNNYGGSVVSYADLRFSVGQLYKVLGFTHTHNSTPNYWYFKTSSSNLESRVKYQKHKLSKLLPIFKEELTEYENMKMNKYERVWDCGNMVFIYGGD